MKDELSEEESLKFIHEVASENGMLNVEKATLGQIYSFLDSLSQYKPKPVKDSIPKVLSKSEKAKLKKSQKIHFKRRFLERVGYILTDEKYKILCDLVKKEGQFVSKHEGADQSIFTVMFERNRLKVVYNCFTNTLITVLPN